MAVGLQRPRDGSAALCSICAGLLPRRVAVQPFASFGAAECASGTRVVGASGPLQPSPHAASVSRPCSLVEQQHAWVMDPTFSAEDGSGGDDGLEEPPVLTLAALQREYAIVRGHAALAAAMPGGEQGLASLSGGGGGGEGARGGDAENVFSQLLALGELARRAILTD